MPTYILYVDLEQLQRGG